MENQAIVVKLPITFEMLAELVSQLSPKDRYRLWELLDEQIDEDLDNDPTLLAEIDAALAEVAEGKYVTLEELSVKLNADD